MLRVCVWKHSKSLAKKKKNMLRAVPYVDAFEAQFWAATTVLVTKTFCYNIFCNWQSFKLFFLRDFIFKKTLFEKLQYLKQEQYHSNYKIKLFRIGV